MPIKHKRITVHIHCQSSLQKGNQAETSWNDSNILPNEFEMRISRKINNMKVILQILAHEAVHIKQFAKGELYDHLYSNTVRWRKNTYDLDVIDYCDQPWEVEAYEREIGLYADLKQFFGISDKELQYNVDKVYTKILDAGFVPAVYRIGNGYYDDDVFDEHAAEGSAGA